MTHELDKVFKKNIFEFRLYGKSDNGYIYAVYEIENNRFSHYEVFSRKTTPLCIDFEKKIYSQNDSKVVYPKDENFGKWAFVAKNIERALEILENFN